MHPIVDRLVESADVGDARGPLFPCNRDVRLMDDLSHGAFLSIRTFEVQLLVSQLSGLTLNQQVLTCRSRSYDETNYLNLMKIGML
jgi:hypothetical protein